MKLKKSLLACAGILSAVLATPAVADGGLTFVVTGDTFNQPYSITNTSTAGETVLGFGISLIAPFGFDVVSGGFGTDNPAAFQSVGTTAATTGLTSVSTVNDGDNMLAFMFNNFGVGETYSWLIDVDHPTCCGGTVIANELIGSMGYADFSNGLRGLGTFQAIMGDPSGAQFVITTFTPSPGVPEPATWAMMLFGFGAIGSAIRRKSQAIARVTA